jgi:hypothetical protein
MDALDVLGVEHALRVLEHLLGPDRDRRRRGLRERHGRDQPLDVLRLGHVSQGTG